MNNIPNQSKRPSSGLQPYLELMRVDRPVGSLLLLWPTLAALWVASDGLPAIGLMVVFTFGTFVMRAAGCVINDYADRKFDGQVERTANRPLATGAVSASAALALFCGLAVLALLLLAFLNGLTRWLALAGLAIAMIYPLMKRWTHMPQVVLGGAFSWGIIMAFAAVQGAVGGPGWLLFIASVLWIVAYDTLYAMVDREDDLKVGIKSTAILFGTADRLMIGALQVSALACLVLLGNKLGYELLYQAALGIIACLFIYQQRLIKNRDREACFKAFANNVWVGFTLLAGVILQTTFDARLKSLLAACP